MAFDAAFLSYIKNEIEVELTGSRVDKIHQPEKDEIDIIFRLKKGSARLLISCNPNTPRIQLTGNIKENPMTPPMFCMFLRKHIGAGKFKGIRQPSFERILFLDFLTRNDLGDEVVKTLAVEIMGKYSNLILVDDKNKILDSVKHVDITMSRERQIFPGLLYELPPSQGKLDLNSVPSDAIVAKIREGNDDELSKAILCNLKGVSPIVCRELAIKSCGDCSSHVSTLNNDNFRVLSKELENLKNDINNNIGNAIMIFDVQKEKPIDFTFMKVEQYDEKVKIKEYTTFSELLDIYYNERDLKDRINQKTHDLVTMINSLQNRIKRKLSNQKTELEKSKNREELRVLGDLVSANLYKLKTNMPFCEVNNFYEEGEPLVKVKLDPSLSPSKNAQKYYTEYRKASAAEKHLKEQIESGEEELKYLATVLFELSHAQTDSNIAEIRKELAGEGYLKKKTKDNLKQNRESQPFKFTSSDGFEIFVGRNNRQNDKLTLKMAAKNDMWFHTKDIPGAHVIVFSDGREIPETTLSEAATLAAFHSKAKDSSQVPVDYTFARYVKKPAGAKPGKVIYVNNKTAYVNPKKEICDKLRYEPKE